MYKIIFCLDRFTLFVASMAHSQQELYVYPTMLLKTYKESLLPKAPLKASQG